MDRLGRTIFKVFEVVTLEIGYKNRPKSLAWKRLHSKIPQKIFHLVISHKILFYLHQPTFGRDESFFPFSSKLLNVHFLNGITQKKKTNKKNWIKCAIATYKLCKQNLRCTNNANKIREISQKKVLVIKLDPPKISRNRRAWFLTINKCLIFYLLELSKNFVNFYAKLRRITNFCSVTKILSLSKTYLYRLQELVLSSLLHAKLSESTTCIEAYRVWLRHASCSSIYIVVYGRIA